VIFEPGLILFLCISTPWTYPEGCNHSGSTQGIAAVFHHEESTVQYSMSDLISYRILSYLVNLLISHIGVIVAEKDFFRICALFGFFLIREFTALTSLTVMTIVTAMTTLTTLTGIVIIFF